MAYDLNTARTVFDVFRQAGLPAAGAAGPLGNFMEESTLNPHAYNAGEGAGGLGQWRGSRWQALQSFAQGNGGQVFDPATQAKFTVHELQTSFPQIWQRLQTAQSPQQAASAFVGYEKPGGYNVHTGDPSGVPSYHDRMNHAANIYSALTGGGFSPGGGATLGTPGAYTSEAVPPQPAGPTSFGNPAAPPGAPSPDTGALVAAMAQQQQNNTLGDLMTNLRPKAPPQPVPQPKPVDPGQLLSTQSRNLTTGLT